MCLYCRIGKKQHDCKRGDKWTKKSFYFREKEKVDAHENEKLKTKRNQEKREETCDISVSESEMNALPYTRMMPCMFVLESG